MSHMTPAKLTATLSLSLLVLTGCATPAVRTAPTAEPAAEAEFPFTVDNCGTEVTFDRPPEKVLAIKSTSIEMMLALDLEDRIAGIAFPDGSYSEQWAPEAELPLVSDRVPGQEAVLNIGPDLVYAGWESNVTADGAGDRETLQSLGVETLISPAACQKAGYKPNPLTWDDIWSEITLVGRVFDVEDNAEELVSAEQQRLDAITPDERGLTALWYSSGDSAPYVGAGQGAPQLLLETVGLDNIAATIDDTWSTMSWEAIAAANPDVIVLVDATWNTADQKRELLASNPATAELSAVKDKRYLEVPFPGGEAGVRSATTAASLATQLAKLQQTPR